MKQGAALRAGPRAPGRRKAAPHLCGELGGGQAADFLGPGGTPTPSCPGCITHGHEAWAVGGVGGSSGPWPRSAAFPPTCSEVRLHTVYLSVALVCLSLHYPNSRQFLRRQGCPSGQQGWLSRQGAGWKEACGLSGSLCHEGISLNNCKAEVRGPNPCEDLMVAVSPHGAAAPSCSFAHPHHIRAEPASGQVSSQPQTRWARTYTHAGACHLSPQWPVQTWMDPRRDGPDSPEECPPRHHSHCDQVLLEATAGQSRRGPRAHCS